MPSPSSDEATSTGWCERRASWGSVALVGRRVGDEAVVTVTDTGIGIPADEQSRLFDRFFRSSNAMDEAIQGTGLGLSIVKTIVL